MSEPLLIRGGTLIDVTGTRTGDLGVVDGLIVPADEAPLGAAEIDASGCIVSTGLVDLHAHLGGG